MNKLLRMRIGAGRGLVAYLQNDSRLLCQAVSIGGGQQLPLQQLQRPPALGYSCSCSGLAVGYVHSQQLRQVHLYTAFTT